MQKFHYNLRLESAMMFVLSFTLFIPGGLFYWFGSISNMTYATVAGLVLFGFAAFYSLLGIFCLAWPKTVFANIDNHKLQLFFGFPGMRQTFSIPLENIDSVDMVPSPFKWLHWWKIGPPEKVQEDRKIIRVRFAKPLPSGLVDKARVLKARNLPLFHFRVSDDGNDLYIRTEPAGGFDQLVKAIAGGGVS